MSAAARIPKAVRSPRGAGPAAGFTLIEMLVAIAIAAILLALAAPSFEDAAVGSKVSDIATKVAVAANNARSEAIKRNGEVVVCMSADGENCTTTGSWEQGWIAFVDRNPRNGAREPSATSPDEPVVFREAATTSGYKVIEKDGKTSLAFPSTGIGATQGTFTVCRALPAAHKSQRTVLISPMGKGTVQKLEGTTC
jgi:type IV fimbrial biogenesis protein FimT